MQRGVLQQHDGLCIHDAAVGDHGEGLVDGRLQHLDVLAFLGEAAAGMLDDETPEKRIRSEAEEEIGYRLHDVRKVFEALMSPGAVTEKLHFFVGEYDAAMRIGDGGGIAEEGEDIEVLELSIDQALAMISDGRIVDAKTIMLLQYAALNIFR